MDDTILDDDTTYSLDDVNKAEALIRRECPGVLISRGDYDYALSVAKADKSIGYHVFRPARADTGQTQIVGDVDRIIALLKS